MIPGLCKWANDEAVCEPTVFPCTFICYHIHVFLSTFGMMCSFPYIFVHKHKVHVLFLSLLFVITNMRSFLLLFVLLFITKEKRCCLLTNKQTNKHVNKGETCCVPFSFCLLFEGERNTACFSFVTKVKEKGTCLFVCLFVCLTNNKQLHAVQCCVPFSF